MKRRSFLILLLSYHMMAFAQSGPAWDASIAAYTAQDWQALHAAQPALEKAYPNHIYTKFFAAWYQDLSGTDVQAALKTYSEIIQSNPDIEDVYYWRAILFREKGLYSKAIADATKAIELSENKNSVYYRERANNYYWSSDFSKAEQDFTKAIALEPRFATNYQDLSNTKLKLGNTKGAELVYTDAIADAKTDVLTITGMYSKFLLGQERYPEALAKSKLLIASNRELSGDSYNNAAIAAYKTKNLTLAKEYADLAIRAEPKNSDYILNRASIALDEEDWSSAKVLAQKALANNPNSALANMMMAVAISRGGGSQAEAKIYEDKAKALDAQQK